MQIHAEHNDTMKISDTVFKKIYLSLYLKGFERVTQCFTVRGSWRPNRTATYWPPLLWPSALSLSLSLLGAGLLYRILSLTHLISNSLTSCVTELYNCSIAHSISPHNWPSGCVTSAVLGMACLIVIKLKKLSCSSQVTLFRCFSLWL